MLPAKPDKQRDIHVSSDEPSSSHTATRSSTKQRKKDKFDEPLDNFVARRKKAKIDKMNSKGKGLQTMLTQYFQLTKKKIKKEKEAHPHETLKDVLESKQYEYDKTCVPGDDDIQIIGEVPPQEVSSWLFP